LAILIKSNLLSLFSNLILINLLVNGTDLYCSTGENNIYKFSLLTQFICFKEGSIYDVRRPENAEIMILKILSYLILYRQTPHIVLPIAIMLSAGKLPLTAVACQVRFSIA
jgi:hypothetical protein